MNVPDAIVNSLPGSITSPPTPADAEMLGNALTPVPGIVARSFRVPFRLPVGTLFGFQLLALLQELFAVPLHTASAAHANVPDAAAAAIAAPMPNLLCTPTSSQLSIRVHSHYRTRTPSNLRLSGLSRKDKHPRFLMQASTTSVCRHLGWAARARARAPPSFSPLTPHHYPLYCP